MNWDDDYTQWRIWIHTKYGWRKVTEGMWFVQDPSLGDLWVPMPDLNLHKKYVEVVVEEPTDIPNTSTWPVYDR